IDAVFGAPDGPWEIVDYKTGRRPPADDELAGFQLDVYALACTEVWGKHPEDLTLTYVYLASNEEVGRPAGPVAETRDRVLAALRAGPEQPFEVGGLRHPDPAAPCHHQDGRAAPAAEPRRHVVHPLLRSRLHRGPGVDHGLGHRPVTGHVGDRGERDQAGHVPV